MATVTGLTAERMIEMENQTVIDGNVVGTDLILITRDGTHINAGAVIGPVGPAGPTFIVCTSTTRPTFSPAEEGKAIYETDTKLIRVWTGTRWRLQEKIICTSATRPVMATADEGVKIFETDTNFEYSWNGASWILAFSMMVPIGFEMTWPGQLASIPSGFLQEDGRLLSRTTYSLLFDVLGTSWNTGGEPATDFRLPESRNRVFVGAGGQFALGSYGGENTHTLTVAEMPQHRHETGGYLDEGPGGGLVRTLVAGNGYFTQYTGNNVSHNIMQQYASKFVIIRAQ